MRWNPMPKWFGNKLYKLFFDRPGLYMILGTWLLKLWALDQAKIDEDLVQVDEIMNDVAAEVVAYCREHGYQ